MTTGTANPLEERILNDFRFHPATEETGPKHDRVRALCLDAARELLTLVPPSRELALALTAVEETIHWAKAGIAKAS